jgi:glutamine---fructose-6-phosphate transaminase (isomerizing)
MKRGASAPLVVSAPRVVAGSRVLSPGAVAIDDGRITAVLDELPSRGPGRLQLDHGVLVPGLVDLQVNGYGGVDLAEADPAGWAGVAAGMATAGVTSFLATFTTAPLDELVAALGRARAALARAGTGARLLGVHMEGPFLSPARKGAHDPAAMLDPSPAAVGRLVEAGREVLVALTLAPERPGAIAAITSLVREGVIVSVGHSDARAAEVAAAADAGARMVTHLFNAQRGLDRREPGVAGQGLADPRFTLGLIADLQHVHPAVCRVVMAAAGDRVALVSDASAAAGMPPGRYRLGGRTVELADHGPPKRDDGTVAGSTLLLDQAVANIAGLGVSLPDAVAAATRVPADLLGRADLGRLAPGATADLAWLSDDLDAIATWVGGTLVWPSPDRLAELAGPPARRPAVAANPRQQEGGPVTIMAAEIAEQPEAVARTLDALRPARAELARLGANARHVLFLARGSSDNAATYGRYLCEVHAGRAASLGAPSLATHYRARTDLHGVLAVALSQSGETEEIVAALRWAAGQGARTVAVTNGAGSALATAADVALVTLAGSERAVPATKTYTTQLAALAVLASALGPADPDFDATLAHTPAAIAAMLGTGPAAADLAAQLAERPAGPHGTAGGASDRPWNGGMIVSGRGLAYSTALELALKLEETCYLPAIGLSHADLVHGPIAVLGPGTPALLVAAGDGPVLPGMTDLAVAVGRRGGRAYGIGGDSAFQAACAAGLPGPDLPETLAPLALVVPGQLLVEALARRLGLDPDRPRGLTKVTQTDNPAAG